MPIRHDLVAGKGPLVDDVAWNDNHLIDGISEGSKIRLPVLIEEKTIPAGTTSVTFSGLDGDSDLEYFLEFDVYIPDTADKILSLKPNNLATNQKSARFGNWSGTVSQNNYTYWWLTGNGWSKAGWAKGFVYIKAKTGGRRYYHGKDTWHNSDFSNWLIQEIGGWWSNTSDNITNLVVASDSGSFSGTIKLYKMVDITL